MSKNLIRAALRERCLIPLARSVRCCATWALALALPLAQAAPLQACFVYVSPIGQAGWSYQHDLGRQELQKNLGDKVSTRYVEGVAEGPDAERVMRELATSGCGLIVATSFGYLEPALRVAAEFPQVKFEHAGGYKSAPNLATYNARYYEARWLAGWLAGKVSKSGITGYVAGFAVPEVVQGINAFALGLREANPQAEVRVLWLNAWFDPAREREAAMSLINQGADVLTNHSGSPAVPQAAQERGVKVLSYQSDMARFAPDAQIAAVTHHWGAHYTRVAQAVLDGRWSVRPVWGSMREGYVALSGLSSFLPRGWLADLEQRRKAIAEGRFKPFSGALSDNTGRQRQAQGDMADADIARMDWLVQGVVGSLPASR